MPWWSWVLIWTGLVLVLLATLAGLAWWLFGKARLLFSDLEELQSVADELAERAEELDKPYAPRQNALVRGLAEVDAEHRTIRRAADERRDARRNARLTRAKLLIDADPLQYAQLAKRK